MSIAPTVNCRPRPKPNDRYFGPQSMVWHLGRERVTLLYGPATAILQVAHPRVAAGVFEHSQFESDPLARLHGTLDVVWAIIFGTRADADAAAADVARRHARVRGNAAALNIDGSPTYSAAEPELLMWVIATLVMSLIDGYRGCVGPVSIRWECTLRLGMKMCDGRSCPVKRR